MTDSISFLSAFLAGVVSFLSPCVLPLVPAYISFITGYDLEQLSRVQDRKMQSRTIGLAVGFVLGFSLIFVLLGASATLIGQWLSRSMSWITKLAGVLIMLLGIHMTGLVRIPLLMREQRYHPLKSKAGLVSAFLVGAAFAFGWSPCVGPLLAGILALAGTKETVGQGMLLLTVYSLGLGIPFILTAALINPFLNWLKGFKRYLPWVERAAGVLLIALGVLLVTGKLMQLSNWFGFASTFAL